MVYVSLAARILVNVEALNMVESVGNVTRHRRVTIIVPVDSNKYVKVEAPAISGETLAHAYQRALVTLAQQIYGPGKAPICEWCSRGEFIKSADAKHTIPGWEKVRAPKGREAEEFEKFVIRNCLVEDIGGFLRAERPPSKRTSRFQVGYMIPTYDTIKFSVLESQFHARHIPSETLKEKGERAAQMIYYVETGSAVYGFMFNLDISTIGHATLVKKEKVISDDDLEKRIKVAIGALELLLGNAMFGAKRSRFLPFIEIRSALAAVAHPIPFTVTPPSWPSFMKETLNKKEKFIKVISNLGISQEVHLFGFSKEGQVEIPQDITKVSDIHELIEMIYNKVMELMKVKK